MIEVLKLVEKLLTDVARTDCSRKTVNLLSFYSSLNEFKRLLAKGYRLTYVYGTREGLVKPIAVFRATMKEFEVTSVVYGEEVSLKDYERLKDGACKQG